MGRRNSKQFAFVSENLRKLVKKLPLYNFWIVILYEILRKIWGDEQLYPFTILYFILFRFSWN